MTSVFLLLLMGLFQNRISLKSKLPQHCNISLCEISFYVKCNHY
ncbi:hypothetical protein GLYMA_18G219050v4 [Glycine max]|nr:hypothetical protein GLYMA_18G219050v4 [Glycine max]KAH1155586.1 hypothetical protein GYH30_050737 [Glycine max]